MNQAECNATLSPSLSVVVVSCNRPAALRRCLSSLVSQEEFKASEVHVISREPTGNTGFQSYPNIRWHQAGENETVPAMRTRGVMASTGEVVALLEDDCTVGPRWYPSILSSHQAGHVAVGGAVEPGNYTRALDWGVYYCEFARFLQPLSGVVTTLPGNNVSYKTKALDPASIEDGFFEVFILADWRESGIELYAADGMEITNINSWQFRHCTSVPFHHARAYAGQRFGKRPGLKRLLYGVLAAALPAVKTARTLREVLCRRRPDLPLLKALPWIVLFHSCWAVGESVGYLAGTGRSAEKWR